MSRRKLIVSFRKLNPEMQAEIMKAFPGDLKDHARKIPRNDTGFFYAIEFDTEKASYLVKIDMDFDKTIDESKMERILMEQEGMKESQRMFYRSGLSSSSDDA